MRVILKKALLCGLMMATSSLVAQNAPVKSKPVPTLDLGLMYSTERARLTTGENVWLQGGNGEVAFPIFRSFGVALNLTGAHADDLGADKLSFSKVAFTAGPRYTLGLHRYRVFAESLFGGVHGFDAVFPSAAGAQKSANAFAMQAGGGVDLDWKKHLAIRLIEADYVRTSLPNGSDNLQNNLKLAAGVIWRLPVR
jgi:hypothetical protein